MSKVLELQNIARSYTTSAGELPVLAAANLTLSAGELVALIGPSGSGKSTLLHIGDGCEHGGGCGAHEAAQQAYWFHLPVP